MIYIIIYKQLSTSVEKTNKILCVSENKQKTKTIDGVLNGNPDKLCNYRVVIYYIYYYTAS